MAIPSSTCISRRRALLSSCQSGSFTVTNVPAQQATYNFTFCLNEPTPSPDCGEHQCGGVEHLGAQHHQLRRGTACDGRAELLLPTGCVRRSGTVHMVRLWSGRILGEQPARSAGLPQTAGFPNVSVSVSDTEPIVQTTGTTDQIKVYQTPLTFTSDTLQIAQLGQSFSATIGATGGGCSVPNISVSGLPPGLTSDGEGDITGTPTQGGTFAVTATASACSGPKNSAIQYLKTLTLVVSTPPLIVNGPLSAVCTIDTNCSLVPTASGWNKSLRLVDYLGNAT